MATTVTYKNNTLVTVHNQTKTLKTAGKFLEDDITLIDVSGSTEAIAVEETADTGGGVVKNIVALDISDTTAMASDVASGKYFYTAAGVKTEGTVINNHIASGTFTGNGSHVITVPIGKKMPNKNFVFRMYISGGAEFSYDSDYKIAELTCVLTDTIASYNLSNNGTIAPTYTANITWDVNNSGTITTLTNYATGYLKYIRSGQTALTGQLQSGRPSIVKDSSGFSIYYTQGNANYKFVNGVIYNWDLYYFGSNPSADIVEVP